MLDGDVVHYCVAVGRGGGCLLRRTAVRSPDLGVTPPRIRVCALNFDLELRALEIYASADDLRESNNDITNLDGGHQREPEQQEVPTWQSVGSVNPLWLAGKSPSDRVYPMRAGVGR